MPLEHESNVVGDAREFLVYRRSTPEAPHIKEEYLYSDDGPWLKRWDGFKLIWSGIAKSGSEAVALARQVAA